MSNENILLIIDSLLVFLQGNICYHGNDKKTVASQTFSSILLNFIPWPIIY